MKLLFLLLFFIFGYELLRLLGNFNVVLKVGTAFPLAFGVISLELFFLNIFGIPINHSFLIIGLILAQLLGFIFSSYKKNKYSKIEFKKDALQIKYFSPAFILLIGGILVVFTGTVAKGLFYPIYIYDSLVGGYDAIAKGIASEGTINNYIFDSRNLLTSVRSTYPPLCPISFSLAYTFGFISSKIICVIFFVSMGISFFALSRDYIGKVGAALLTLLLLISPEYLAFSSLSSSNPIATYYVSTGLILLFIWSDKNEIEYFILSIMMLTFGIFTRSESIVFIGGGGLVIFINYVLKRDFYFLLKKVIPFLLIPISIFICWQIYLKVGLKMDSGQPISLIPNLDGDRIQLLWSRIMNVTLDTKYYGYVCYIFALFIFLNIKDIFQRKGNFFFLLSILCSWLFLFIIYNQLEVDYTINYSGDWINSGYKRTFFCFLPLMYFYVASTNFSQRWIKKTLL